MSSSAICNKSKSLWAGISILSTINPSMHCLALSILAGNVRSLRGLATGIGMGSSIGCMDLINQYRREKNSSSTLVWKTRQKLAKLEDKSVYEIALDVFAEGIKYKEGIEVPQNLTRARLFFEFAAERERHSDAASEAGLMYANGIGLDKDPAKACYFFIKGAKPGTRLGGVAAQYLGCAYSTGKGVPKDNAKAVNYLEKAMLWERGEAVIDLIKHFHRENDEASALVWQTKYQTALQAGRNINSVTFDLAVHYKVNGNHTAAIGQREFYAQWKLISKQPVIKTMGGNLLSIATVYVATEERYMSAPDLKDFYNSERLKIQTRLENAGVFSKGETITYQKIPGFCLGINLKFISMVLHKSHSPSKPELIAGARNFVIEAGPEAVAIQLAYLHCIMDPLRRRAFIFPTVPLCPKKDDLQVAKDRSELEQSVLKPFYRIYGYHLISLPHLGIPGQLDEITCLNAWLQEPDGCYNLSLTTDIGFHDMILFKTTSSIIIWDPGYGLVEFPNTSTTSASIITFLATIYPGRTNHNLDFRRIEVI